MLPRRGSHPPRPPTISLMAVVIASDLGKDIAGEPLLRGISFKLERRDRMTLSGRNGAGKTTLLRMLAGEASVDWRRAGVRQGRARSRCTTSARRASATSPCATTSSRARRSWWRSSRSWRALEQAMAGGAHDEATLGRYAEAQARLEHAGGYAWRDRALATLHGLGFRDDADLDRSLDTFSGRRADPRVAGSRPGRRPRICCSWTSPPTISTSSRWSGSRLTSSRLDAAIVLVAHDRWFLEAVGTSVLELEAGRGKFFAGHVARVAQGEGRARAGPGPGDRAPAGRDRAPGAVRRPASAPGPGPARRSRGSRSCPRSSGSSRDPPTAPRCSSPSSRPSAAAGWCSSSSTPSSRPATRSCCTTPSCGWSAASTCRWWGPTAPARRR